MLAMIAASALVAADPPERVIIDLTPKPCAAAASEADVTVCARRTPDYRIDPQVLAGARAREALPTDARSGQEKAVAMSCHDQPSKCQGGGVIPILPAAMKTVEAVVLAVRARTGASRSEPSRTSMRPIGRPSSGRGRR